MRRVVFFLGFLLFLTRAGAGAGEAFAAASITSVSGVVQVQGRRSPRWLTVDVLPHSLQDGDEVRTGQRAKATIRFHDGSRIELGADAAFALEEASAKRISMRLKLGEIRAFVKKLLSRRFEVRTPTAVAAVRGTEFRVRVLSGGRTSVQLYKGLLGVEDNRGNQVLLHPGERIRVDARGMGVPQRVPSQRQLRRQGVHTGMKREIGLDQSKAEILAAAAREIKLAEFQQGKAIIDVGGNRVRIEEYILRPRADQFKLVILNERKSRFDYFFYQGTFNKALPDDLRIALRQLGGGVDTAPEYFLTEFESGRSNTRDSIHEIARGGHLVDLNSNATATDDVRFFFDSALDKFVDVSGRSVFKTLFDRYGFYLNGKLKNGYSGANIQTIGDAVQSTLTDPITGAALTSGNAYMDGGFLATRSVSVTFPNAEQMHQRIFESYSDGSFIAWDNYIINDQGQLASVAEFQGLTSGSAFRQKLLDFNYEQVITATEFGGRKIDLVISPKILIQSGLIQ